MTGTAGDDFAAGQALLEQARRAREDIDDAIEDTEIDGALLRQAAESFRRAADTARTAGRHSDEGRAHSAEAQAQMLLPHTLESVTAAEAAGRRALGLLDAVTDRKETLAAYVVLGRALAQLATLMDPQQRSRVETARAVLEAGEVLALQAGDVSALARLRDSLSRVLGERFKGERDENLMDAVVIGEQALPALREGHHPDSLELPWLLNHLGNCCVKVSIAFRDWVRRGQAHYREGAAAVDAVHYPRLRRALENNVAMTEGLLAQDVKYDALPEQEMVSRYAAATQDAMERRDVEDAQAQALGFLRWAWSLQQTPNVHVGEAHKLLGKLAMGRQAWDEAERHFYESSLVLSGVLPPQHRWTHLKDDALALLAEAMKRAGRGGLAQEAAFQAQHAWSAVRRVIDQAAAAGEGEAAAALDQALSLYPDFPPALMARAAERLLRREIGRALADLEAYLMLRPRDAKALTLRAGAWTEIGEAERSLSDWNAVLELNADDAIGLLNRAQVLINLDRPDDARRDLDKLIATRPDQPEAYYFRAACREKVGDLAGAADDLEHALPGVSDPPAGAELEQRIARLRAGGPA